MRGYDFVIIGAGTAGCVVARRLAEQHPECDILVLEAGEDRSTDERVCIPGLGRPLLGNSDFDWNYTTTPQPGLDGRQLDHPRGKCVGGNSAINSFALIYPNKAGIDVWAELGNEGWDWKRLAEGFQTFQSICEPSDTVKDVLPIVSYGNNLTTGPIQASVPVRANESHKAWVDTFRGLAMENTSDPLNGEALGGYISTCHITGDTRERSHAGVFLGPDNIRLVTGALVQKISFANGSSPLTADAVVYLREGKQHLTKAKREVILAAGAFASPQILELSGIGNPGILQDHGIQVIYANGNVGENLQDHIRAGISFEVAAGVLPPHPPDPDEVREEYEKYRDGPLADAVRNFAYLPLTPFLEEPIRRDLQARLDAYVERPGLTKYERIMNEYVRNMTMSDQEASFTAYLSRKAAAPPSKSDPSDQVGLFGMLAHPFSRGSVHICSNDIEQRPTIDCKYYDEEIDLEIHARQLQALAKLAQAAPLKDLFQPGGKRLPATGDVYNLDDAKDMCRKHSGTNYHPCGTCSMLPEADGGVVDSKLRVYGTRNVRVVDASIFPIIPRGNIITTVYAVAEKAAEIIGTELAEKTK